MTSFDRRGHGRTPDSPEDFHYEAMADEVIAVRLDHTVALYEALSHGQLCVVPGASHFLPVERPEETLKVVPRFFDSNAHPETMFPIRRR